MVLGDRMVILTRKDRVYSRPVLMLMMQDYERAWKKYEELIGSSPTLVVHKDKIGERTFVAETSQNLVGTHIAALGLVGNGGIELHGPFMQRTYDLYLKSGRHDHIVFHEMGRNFWMYRLQLGAIEPLEVGFAVFNKFLVIERAGLRPGPFKDFSFPFYRQSATKDLFEKYLQDPKLNWRTALMDRAAPKNPQNWGVHELASGFYVKLHEAGGDKGYREFFASIKALPPTKDPEQAARYFVQTANKVTGQDFSLYFKDPGLR